MTVQITFWYLSQPQPQPQPKKNNQIIKYYVLSPVEKNYISKIEAELKKSEELDEEIKEVQKKIDEEKEKKLQRYKEEKEGKVKANNKETCEALLREISVHENKLEKAN